MHVLVDVFAVEVEACEKLQRGDGVQRCGLVQECNGFLGVGNAEVLLEVDPRQLHHGFRRTPGHGLQMLLDGHVNEGHRLLGAHRTGLGGE